jgi:hypothetical protein
MTLSPTTAPAEKKRKALAYPRPCTREVLTEGDANRKARRCNARKAETILLPASISYCAQCQGFHFNHPKRLPKKTRP